MKLDDVKKICVVGAGNMGHQISLLCALSGFRVSCTDVSEEQLGKAQAFMESYLPGRVKKNRLTEEQAKQTQENLTFTTSLADAAKDADFVIEAATEKIEIKTNLFKQLDELTPLHAILATNSSFLVSSLVAHATNRPDKVCNMHFFNPALVMKCVEVVKGPHTSEETAELTMELSRKLNKVPVKLNKEIYGFLVNRILAAINKEALFLLDLGVASAEDIDSAVVNALGHPMGPFRLLDLTGIDLSYLVGMERFQETLDPAEMPSPTITTKYAKGEWGEKTGKGFYEYK